MSTLSLSRLMPGCRVWPAQLGWVSGVSVLAVGRSACWAVGSFVAAVVGVGVALVRPSLLHGRYVYL